MSTGWKILLITMVLSVGWTCKKVQPFKEGKCSMKCFENNTPLTISAQECKRVVY